MHAILFQVDLKENWQGDPDADLDKIVGGVKSVPGFVRGTWTSDGRRGVSLVVFDNEQTARGVAANAAVPPDAAVAFRSADVYEVVREV